MQLQVRRTQRAIKQVLTERYYSWRDAETIAKDDAEIDLSGNGPVYTPSEFVDEDLPAETESEVPAEQLEAEVKTEQRTASNI